MSKYTDKRLSDFEKLDKIKDIVRDSVIRKVSVLCEMEGQIPEVAKKLTDDLFDLIIESGDTLSLVLKPVIYLDKRERLVSIQLYDRDTLRDIVGPNRDKLHKDYYLSDLFNLSTGKEVLWAKDWYIFKLLSNQLQKYAEREYKDRMSVTISEDADQNWYEINYDFR